MVVSVGRRPFSDDLGLDGTGVEVDERGFVEVDERCRTGEAGVWAIGDLHRHARAGPRRASPRASWSSTTSSARTRARSTTTRCRGRIYCHPEVAFAGHSEEPAKEAGFDVVTSKHRYIGNGRAMIVGETEGLVKVIAEKRPDGRAGRILGVHMVGPWVTEQLGRATSPSTGRRPSTRSPTSSSPTRR